MLGVGGPDNIETTSDTQKRQDESGVNSGQRFKDACPAPSAHPTKSTNGTLLGCVAVVGHCVHGLGDLIDGFGQIPGGIPQIPDVAEISLSGHLIEHGFELLTEGQ